MRKADNIGEYMNEEKDLKKIQEILEDLTTKVDRLSKKVNMEGEDIVEESRLLEKLNRGVKEMSEYLYGAKDRILELKYQSEDKIAENPIAYILGAFVGGIIIGHMVKGKNKK